MRSSGAERRHRGLLDAQHSARAPVEQRGHHVVAASRVCDSRSARSSFASVRSRTSAATSFAMSGAEAAIVPLPPRSCMARRTASSPARDRLASAIACSIRATCAAPVAPWPSRDHGPCLRAPSSRRHMRRHGGVDRAMPRRRVRRSRNRRADRAALRRRGGMARRSNAQPLEITEADRQCIAARAGGPRCARQGDGRVEIGRRAGELGRGSRAEGRTRAHRAQHHDDAEQPGCGKQREAANYVHKGIVPSRARRVSACDRRPFILVRCEPTDCSAPLPPPCSH